MSFSSLSAPGFWTETLLVHSYDVDLGQRVSLETLCRYFQEAAWNHAEQLGVGYRRLEEQNRVWVLSRLLVKVQRAARWGETLLIRTWPRPAKSVFAMRDFELLDSAGAQVAAGTSGWLVLDARTRKPQRVDKLVSSFENMPDRRALAEDPEKLPQPDASASRVERPVHYSDLDVNRHVNGARYIGWLLDSYPLDFLRTHTATRLEVNYLGETLAGETVTLNSQGIAPGEFLHSIATRAGETCRARLRWAEVLA
jgi:acyl-ACP thioesterase